MKTPTFANSPPAGLWWLATGLLSLFTVWTLISVIRVAGTPVNPAVDMQAVETIQRLGTRVTSTLEGAPVSTTPQGAVRWMASACQTYRTESQGLGATMEAYADLAEIWSRVESRVAAACMLPPAIGRDNTEATAAVKDYRVQIELGLSDLRAAIALLRNPPVDLLRQERSRLMNFLVLSLCAGAAVLSLLVVLRYAGAAPAAQGRVESRRRPVAPARAVVRDNIPEEAFRRAPVPLMILDRSGCVERWNGAAEKAAGARQAEFAKRPHWDWLALGEEDAGRLREEFASACAGTSLGPGDLTWRSKTGTAGRFRWWRIPLGDGQGSVQKVLAVAAPAGPDFEDPRWAAMDGAVQLLANEIRLIHGFADLLLSDLDEENPLRGDLGQIQRAGLRSAEILRRLHAVTGVLPDQNPEPPRAGDNGRRDVRQSVKSAITG